MHENNYKLGGIVRDPSAVFQAYVVVACLFGSALIFIAGLFQQFTE